MTARIIHMVRPNSHDLAAELRELCRLAHRIGNRVLADVQGTQGARLAAVAATGVSARVAVDLRDGQVRVAIVRPETAGPWLAHRGHQDGRAVSGFFSRGGEYGTAQGDLPIGTLIALASTMPLDDLRAAAERILGVGRVHRSRQQITYQLKTHARTSPGVDLEAFARGDTRTSLVQVRRFIAARLGKVVTSRRQALGLLRDEGLIGPPPKGPEPGPQARRWRTRTTRTPEPEA